MSAETVRPHKPPTPEPEPDVETMLERPLKFTQAVLALILTALTILGVYARSESRIDIDEERIRVMQIQVDHLPGMEARLIRIEDKVDQIQSDLRSGNHASGH